MRVRYFFYPWFICFMRVLLEDLVSGDPSRVWASACAVIVLRKAEVLDMLVAHLPEIRQKTHDLELGGGVFPNAEHLKFSLRKLEYHRDGAGCLCRLYPEYLMYNPQKEATAEHVQIDEVTYVNEKWVDAYVCTCTRCGTKFRVTEGESHYPWWKWEVV